MEDWQIVTQWVVLDEFICEMPIAFFLRELCFAQIVSRFVAQSESLP